MQQQSVQYLSPKDLCDRWGRRVTEKTLANWRQQGQGPRATKIGGRIAYHVDDVAAYEESRRINGEPGGK